jgi:hypothetical protein
VKVNEIEGASKMGGNSKKEMQLEVIELNNKLFKKK